ncbi:hypothetical protein Pan153_21810 [Gimesia panareensis]|uniref:Uncharacterized protein n=1 Tax=Gimesia panareensis TaxID=2527978 RepID=A0A518FMD5_9PLAN|nr:hypothetical protein Pan153_21810 [Gimesia panareensis]
MNTKTTTTQNASDFRQNCSPSSSEFSNECEPLKPVEDFGRYLTTYARQKPGTAALWCFGVGFILGWKLKPW